MNSHGRAHPPPFSRILRWTRLVVLLAGWLVIAPALQAQGGPSPIEGDTLVWAESASGEASLFPVTGVLPPAPHGLPFASTQADRSVLTANGGLNVGTNAALMSVGAAAIGIGLLIGGDAGTAVAVAGAGVALVGLYRFVR